MAYQPTVVFDFDGVIHSYVSHWQGVDVIPDPPVPMIQEEIERIREAGYKVFVVSTRCASPNGMEAVKNYLAANDIVVDDVLAEKPPALVYIDDRAIRFDGNPCGLLEQIQEFKPWHEGGIVEKKPPVDGLRRCAGAVYDRSTGKWNHFGGWFHAWSTMFEKFDNGAVPVASAIIEDDKGIVRNVSADTVIFV